MNLHGLAVNLSRGKMDWVSNVARSTVRRSNVLRSNGGGKTSWTLIVMTWVQCNMNRGQTVRLSTSHIGHKSQTQTTSGYLAALSTVSVSDISSVHDARVLRVSSLGHMPENHNWPADDFHLLGDTAYPLLPSLLVPYWDNGYLTEAQRKFNATHSSACSIVEKAFGRLKGKFRRLKACYM